MIMTVRRLVDLEKPFERRDHRGRASGEEKRPASIMKGSPAGEVVPRIGERVMRIVPDQG